MFRFNLYHALALPRCSSCRTGAPRLNKKTCDACSLRDKARRRANKMNQRCISCPNKTEFGYSYCRACLDKRADRGYTLPDGVCSSCWKEKAREGACTCEKCFAKAKAKLELKTDSGICQTCGGGISKERREKRRRKCYKCSRVEARRVRKYERMKAARKQCAHHSNRPLASGNKTRCSECATNHAKRAQERRERLRAEGLCTWCGILKAKPPGSYCPAHQRRAKRQREKSRKRAKTAKT